MEILHSEHNGDLTESSLQAALDMVNEKYSFGPERLLLIAPEEVAYSAGLMVGKFGLKDAAILPNEMASEDSWALAFLEFPVFYSPGA